MRPPKFKNILQVGQPGWNTIFVPALFSPFQTAATASNFVAFMVTGFLHLGFFSAIPLFFTASSLHFEGFRYLPSFPLFFLQSSSSILDRSGERRTGDDRQPEGGEKEKLTMARKWFILSPLLRQRGRRN